MMNVFILLPIYLVCLAGLVLAKKDDLSCFVTGECTESPHVGGGVVENKEGCLKLCECNIFFRESFLIPLRAKRVGR